LVIIHPFFYKSWLDKGVNIIEHLFDFNNKFLCFPDFCKKYSVQTNVLMYQGVTNAAKKLLKSNPN
jgi:hypothetical protein